MERILRYDRAPVVTALAALTILSWTYLVVLTRDYFSGRYAPDRYGDEERRRGRHGDGHGAISLTSFLLMLIM